MRATWPATRPAFALLELLSGALEVEPSRLRLLHRLNPAKPLVARERRDVLPRRSRFSIRKQDRPQVGWHLVNDAVRD